jgi:NAD(P)-dependent dehydrogenase (short-subunit alcohol dehydrogenase family)
MKTKPTNSSKIAIVTGASGGIGRSAAIQTARNGVGVIVTYNSRPDEAQVVVSQIEAAGGTARALRLDVGAVDSFPGFREQVLVQLHQHWDRDHFDFLVNNAGHGFFKPLENVSEAEFDGLLNVHLKGPFFLTQTLLPLMTNGGAIVNVTSATTRVATVGVAPYASCKGGLEVLTRYMAKEFGPRGIRANSVSPGAIRTGLGGGLTPDLERTLAGQSALGRVGEPDDVGSVIASLLSDELTWVNAQSIEVAGGYNV